MDRISKMTVMKSFIIRVLTLVTVVLLFTCCGDNGKRASKWKTQDERIKEYYLISGKQIMTRAEYLAYVDSVFRADHSPISYASYAGIFRRNGEIERALRYTDTALTMITLPGDLNDANYIRFVRSQCYDDMGQTENAIKELNLIIDSGPYETALEARETLCRLLYHKDRFREALEALPDSLSLEGRIYLQLCKEALDSLERIRQSKDSI